MPVLAFRPRRLLASILALAILAVACTPAADPGPTGSVTPIAGPPTARPVAVVEPTISPTPDATGDLVTGGEPEETPEPSAIADPTPAPPPATKPEPTATPSRAAPDAADPFAMNLYRKGDFVAQYTFEWCVGASLQMALNMSTGESHTSKADQQDLWEMARDQSSSPFGGANPTGWTAVLNDVGIGPYVLVSIPTLDEALDVAAKAIRATDRPVGLVMWRGRHAWVMSGFEATADPAKGDDFDVTGIRVQDPLYPNGSSVWGPSPRPNSLVSPATLGEQFVVRDVNRSRVNLGVPTGYLMIVPVAAA